MAKNVRAHQPGPRLTRAERRAAERAEEKSQRSSKRQNRGISRGSLIGVGVTLVAVLAIFVYALMRNQGTTNPQTAPGLTDPNALAPAPSLLRVGSAAPNFTLYDTTGRRHTLAVQMGRPVLLEFFAVWCPVCHGEAPIMAKLTKDYKAKGVQVLSVLANPYGKNYENSSRTDLTLASKSDLSWYAHTYNVQHAQLIDPSFEVTNEYGVGSYPGLYIIDPMGKIAYATEGHTSYATLAKELNTSLKMLDK